MQLLIWGGALVTLLGIAGLLYVGLKVGAAKRELSGEDALKDAIQKLLPVNLASLFVAALGLMMVIIGITLS